MSIRNFETLLDYDIPLKVRYYWDDLEIKIVEARVCGKEVSLSKDAVDQLEYDIIENEYWEDEIETADL